MADLSQVLGGVPGLAGYLGQDQLNRQQEMQGLQTAGTLAKLLQLSQAAKRQQQFESARQALGPSATPEALSGVAMQFASPTDILHYGLASQDKKAQLAATVESAKARLAQQAQQAEMMHEFRLGQLSSAQDRNAETSRHNQTMETLNQQNANLNAQLKMLGINVQQQGLELKRQQLDQGNKPPSGYRYTPDKNLEAIPGGPADTKIQGALNQDTAAMQSMSADLDRLANEANALKDHPGLGKATGVMSVVPGIGGTLSMPGSDAANFKARLGTLESQVAFGVLQNMRNNSKSGGALGQVSDREEKMLAANLAALDRAQGPDEYKAALGRIIKYTEDAKDRLRTAYNMKHGGQAPPAAIAPTQTGGVVDFNSLPK